MTQEYTITVQELKTLMDNNVPIQLIDVRNIEKHTAYNIGGQLIPSETFDKRCSEIDTDKPVILYCTSGRRSMHALLMLLSFGFTNLKSLEGGVTAWREAFDQA